MQWDKTPVRAAPTLAAFAVVQALNRCCSGDRFLCCLTKRACQSLMTDLFLSCIFHTNRLLMIHVFSPHAHFHTDISCIYRQASFFKMYEVQRPEFISVSLFWKNQNKSVFKKNSPLRQKRCVSVYDPVKMFLRNPTDITIHSTVCTICFIVIAKHCGEHQHTRSIGGASNYIHEASCDVQIHCERQQFTPISDHIWPKQLKPWLCPVTCSPSSL